MRDSILNFLDSKKIAIVGASPNKDNFGRYLLTELKKKGYEGIPVNPGYEEVEGIPTLPSVRELPEEVQSVILTTPSHKTDEIVEQCTCTPIKRVWMIRGVGRGSYTESAHEQCRKNGIEVVHGFCPMMFFGEGMHQFHFWLRKTFGKVPVEYRLSVN